jgi:hypothetical protein
MDPLRTDQSALDENLNKGEEFLCMIFALVRIASSKNPV